MHAIPFPLPTCANAPRSASSISIHWEKEKGKALGKLNPDPQGWGTVEIILGYY
jgi:hypothetical protein